MCLVKLIDKKMNFFFIKSETDLDKVMDYLLGSTEITDFPLPIYFSRIKPLGAIHIDDLKLLYYLINKQLILMDSTIYKTHILYNLHNNPNVKFSHAEYNTIVNYLNNNSNLPISHLVKKYSQIGDMKKEFDLYKQLNKTLFPHCQDAEIYNLCKIHIDAYGFLNSKDIHLLSNALLGILTSTEKFFIKNLSLYKSHQTINRSILLDAQIINSSILNENLNFSNLTKGNGLSNIVINHPTKTGNTSVDYFLFTSFYLKHINGSLALLKLLKGKKKLFSILTDFPTALTNNLNNNNNNNNKLTNNLNNNNKLTNNSNNQINIGYYSYNKNYRDNYWNNNTLSNITLGEIAMNKYKKNIYVNKEWMDCLKAINGSTAIDLFDSIL